MLTESKRTELQNRMAERLAEAGQPVRADEIVCVECFAQREGKSGISGLAGVIAGRIAFVAKDLLEGEVWLQWPKTEIGELRVVDGILGADLVITGSAGSIKLTRLSKDDRRTLEAALTSLGYFGPAAAQPPAAAPPSAAVQPAPAVVAPAAPAADVPPAGAPAADSPPGVEAESADSEDAALGILLVDEAEPTPVPEAGPRTRGGLVVCPVCGKENKPNYKFCLGCGINMDQMPAGAAAAVGRSDFPMLIGMSGPEQGKTFPLKGDVIKIGRSEGATITISATDLSRVHAVIEVSSRGCTVIDLGSANGTFVNGKRVSSHSLKNGEVIRLGSDHEFVFVEAGADVRTTTGVSVRSRSAPSTGGTDVQRQKLIVLVAVAVAVMIAGLVMVVLMGQ